MSASPANFFLSIQILPSRLRASTLGGARIYPKWEIPHEYPLDIVGERLVFGEELWNEKGMEVVLGRAKARKKLLGDGYLFKTLREGTEKKKQVKRNGFD